MFLHDFIRKIKIILLINNTLNDKKTHSKPYWSILNSFSSNVKICTTPLIYSSGRIATIVSEKADLFNDFFASQFTPLKNTNTIPVFKDELAQ